MGAGTGILMLAGAALLGAAPIAGCGGSSQTGEQAGLPASCGHVAPCDSNPVGTWALQGVCAETAALTATAQATCPGATIQVTSASASGTILLGADQSADGTTAQRVISEIDTAPLDCFGSATSCADLDGQLTDATVGVVTRACTGTTTCTCEITEALQIDQGSYETSPGQIAIMTTAGDYYTSFCVQGSEMHFIETDNTTGAVLFNLVGTAQ